MDRGSKHDQRIIPTGLLELTFYLADRPRSLDPGREILDNTLISGQQNSPYDLQVTGTLNLFSISFQPHGAMMFFDLPLIELCDQTIPLKYLDKEWVDRIENELFEAQGFQERVGVIERALGQLLMKNHKRFDAVRIKNSIHLINEAKGQIDINMLAGKACLSRKQFERIFTSCIGISPKRFLRIVRFQHVLFLKQLNTGSSFTDLAYRCGYYDQSHMINDFKALSGLSPCEFFSTGISLSDYFY